MIASIVGIFAIWADLYAHQVFNLYIGIFMERSVILAMALVPMGPPLGKPQI